MTFGNLGMASVSIMAPRVAQSTARGQEIKLDSVQDTGYTILTMTNGTMTQAEARTRIKAGLSEWRSIGEVARRLGISRSTVEREVSRMHSMGMLEARHQRFFRNGEMRLGRAFRLAVVECAIGRS